MENLINAKVIYKDLDNSNNIISCNNISGQAGQPINVKYYRSHVPADYQFESFGHFDHYLKVNEVNVIYVKKRQNASASNKSTDSKPKGAIMIDYINANNQLVGHKTISGKVGSSFNTDQCKSTFPKGFKFNRILTGSNISTFKSESQIMVVQVAKIKHANVIVKYIEPNGKQVGNIKTRAVVDVPFNMQRYEKIIPAGYKFVKVMSSVPKTIKHDQVIKVEVALKQQPQKQVHAKEAHRSNHDDHARKGAHTKDNEDPKKIGDILMKLASSLHDLGSSISRSNKL